MNAPQELLGEIFSHLPQDNDETLRACSLVAKSWTPPAQGRLFSSVEINTNTYQSWKGCISPQNTELLGYVRSLHYFTPNFTCPDPITPQIDTLSDYLPSFCNLHSLILSGIRIQSDFSQQIGIFSAFQSSLTSLHFQEITLPWIVFIAIVDYFPSLRNLGVQDLLYDERDQQQMTPTRPLRGRLSVIALMENAVAILADRFSQIPVAYDELTIYGNPMRCPTAQYYQQIIDTCGESVKNLHLHPMTGLVNLSKCQLLRELEFYTISPRPTEFAIISSIVSTNIRTITFVMQHLQRIYASPLDDSCMELLDNAMCQLVQKLSASGYKHTLELYLRLLPGTVSRDNLNPGKYFPKFRENGRVIISDTSGGEEFELA